MSVPAIHCYSQRMLNHFRGLMSVVEIDDGDAVSIDGIHWILYIEDPALKDIAQIKDEINKLDIRYGSWSEKSGLKRAPMLSTTDLVPIEAIGQHLVKALQRHVNQVPFPSLDRYELWMMQDNSDHPLALLDSTLDRPRRDSAECTEWRVSRLCRESFVSNSLVARGFNTDNHAEHVARIVNEAAGSRSRAQWFLRQEDGRGVPYRAEETLGEEYIQSAGTFPELLVSSRWSGADAQSVILVDEFLHWQAPWLLLMPGLSDMTRAQLEPLACQQAEFVAAQHHLYPKVIDGDVLNAALVEAVLRKSDVSSSPGEGKTIAPVFNNC